MVTFFRRAFGTRPGREAKFVLRYVPAKDQALDVGLLEFDGTYWTFGYTDDYRRASELMRPIEGFEDLDRTYKSQALFPFFAVRIPDLDRKDVRRQVKDAKHIDTADLLRQFGRRVVSSPGFELQPL